MTSLGAGKNYANRILQTVVCNLRTVQGQVTPVRVMLDQGSEISLIRRQLAKNLKMKGDKKELQMSVAGGGVSKSSEEMMVPFMLESLTGDYVSPLIYASTTSKPISMVRSVPVDPKRHPHLQNIEFTETYPTNEPKRIDILLDTANCMELLTGEIIKSKEDAPLAIGTRLGYVLAGHYPTVDQTEDEALPPAVYSLTEADQTVIDLLRQFVCQEQLGMGLEDSPLSVDEMSSLEAYQKALRYDAKNKKYHTQLLWRKNKKHNVTTNFKVALATAVRQNAKAFKDQVKPKVDEVFQALLDAGFAKVIKNTTEVKAEGYYIPVVLVYRPESLTTKIRLCLNASSKTPTGDSLNSCLYPGVDYLPDLQKLLILFRTRTYVWSTDISKMFWRLGVEDFDQKYLKYIWFFGKDKEPTVMQMTSLPFGLVNAPFQAIGAVRDLATRMENKFPMATKLVMSGLYVDDAVSTMDTMADSVTQARQLKEMLTYGSFFTQKWVANDPAIIDQAAISPDQRNPNRIVKILGIQWDTQVDKLTFDFVAQVPEVPKVLTKRVLLSIASSLWDPLGYLSPFTLTAKLLFQRTWLEKPDVKWNDVITGYIADEFKVWAAQIPKLKNLTFPRLTKMPSASHVTLALFADASLNAYGAVAYLLSWKAGKVVKSNLLMSKTKLAPVKFNKDDEKLSIARLELLATVIAVKLGLYLRDAMGQTDMPIWYFSDSMVTLYRIRNKTQEKYKAWVFNRLYYILQNASVDEFHYIPGKLNVGDMCTKPVAPELFVSSHLWLHGPPFLLLPQKRWPKEQALSEKEAREVLEVDLKEVRKETPEEAKVKQVFKKSDVTGLLPVSAAATGVNPLITQEWEDWLLTFQHWSKPVHILAWCRRFISNLRAKVRDNKLSSQPVAKRTRRQTQIQKEEKSLETASKSVADSLLKPQEVQAATLFVCKLIQHRHFKAEHDALERSGQVAHSSSLVKLIPFLDENGLIRMTTRLTQAEQVSDAEKYLIILPKHSALVEKLVLHLHELNGHCGIAHTDYVTRQNYWLIGGKKEIRRILHTCKNKECRPLVPITQQMSSIPKERFQAIAPFTHVSVDAAGPIYCYHQCNLEKCPHPASHKLYLAVYSDWYSRGCHLEVVPDLSTPTFLASLQRLIARRGCPSFIYSDQHKSYKHASREIKKLYKAIDFVKIQEYLVQRKCQWKFSHPLAPWTNSLVERMIRSAKKGLRSSLGNMKVHSIQMLETCLQQVEAMINNRPLADCSRDGKDPLPVTPAMLMLGRPLTVLPDVTEETPDKTDVTKAWLKRQKFMEDFHKAWRKDYYLSLQKRQKWHTAANPLKLGSVCLVHDPSLSRHSWKIARVVKIKAGGDHLQRLIKLQLPSTGSNKKQKFIWRHINALSLLEDAAPDEAEVDQATLQSSGSKKDADVKSIDSGEDNDSEMGE